MQNYNEQLLISLIAGEFRNEKLDFKEEKVDWENLYKLCNDQRIFPLVFRRLSECIPAEIYPKYEARNKQLLARAENSLTELAILLDQGKQENVSFVVTKGIVLSFLIYGDHTFRHSGDIDLLIEEKKVGKLHNLLLQEGYFHACGKNDVHEVSDHDFEILPYPILKGHHHHEYFEYFKKQDNGEFLQLEIGRYIHNAVRNPQHIEAFIASEAFVQINSVSLPTLNLEHTFLYLCENIYEDSTWIFGRPKLKDYMDIIMFINKYRSAMDWKKVAALSKTYKIEDIIYLSLMQTEELFPGMLPSFVISELPDVQADIKHHVPLLTNKNIRLRVFDEAFEREQWSNRQLKERCYTKANKNHENPLLIGRKEKDDPSTNLQIIDSKYQYSIKYSVSHDDKNIYFSFKIPKELYSCLGKFTIHLSFVDNHLQNKRLMMLEYWVSRDMKGNLIYHNSEETNYSTKSQILEEEVLFLLEVELSKLNALRPGDKVAYNIALVEEVYPNIFHNLSVNYWDREYWINPPILMISV